MLEVRRAFACDGESVLTRGVHRGRAVCFSATRMMPSNPHWRARERRGRRAEVPKFQALPCLTNDDVAEVPQVARTRTVALLRSRGVLADDESGVRVVTTDEARAESEPALAELAVASLTGRVPARPELRRRRARKRPIATSWTLAGGHTEGGQVVRAP
jgi:hypothetical protein